jgi:pyruvate,water dikinase
MLIRLGIENISLSIDAVSRTRRLIAAAERRILLDAARASAAGQADEDRP